LSGFVFYLIIAVLQQLNKSSKRQQKIKILSAKCQDSARNIHEYH